MGALDQERNAFRLALLSGVFTRPEDFDSTFYCCGGGGGGGGGAGGGDGGGDGGGGGGDGGGTGGGDGGGAGAGEGGGAGAGEGGAGAGAGEGGAGAGAGEGGAGAGAGEGGAGEGGAGEGGAGAAGAGDAGGFGGGEGGGFGGGEGEGGGFGGGEGGGFGGGEGEGGSAAGAGEGEGEGGLGGPAGAGMGTEAESGPEAGPEAGPETGPEVGPEEEPGAKGKEAEPEEEPEFEKEITPPPPPPVVPPPPLPPPPLPPPPPPRAPYRDDFKVLEAVEGPHFEQPQSLQNQQTQQQQQDIISIFTAPGSLFLNPDQLSQLLGVDPNTVNTTQGLQDTLQALGIDLSHVPGTLATETSLSQQVATPTPAVRGLDNAASATLSNFALGGLPAGLVNDAGAVFPSSSEMANSAANIGGFAGTSNLTAGDFGPMPGLSDLSPTAFGDQLPSDTFGGGTQFAGLEPGGTMSDVGAGGGLLGAIDISGTPYGGPGATTYMGATPDVSGGGLQSEAALKESAAQGAPPEAAQKEEAPKEEAPSPAIELPEVTVTPEKAETDVAGASAAGEERGTAPAEVKGLAPPPSPAPEGAAPEAPAEPTEAPAGTTGEKTAGLAPEPTETRSLAEQAGLQDIPAAPTAAAAEPETEAERTTADYLAGLVVPPAEARGQTNAQLVAAAERKFEKENGPITLDNPYLSTYTPGEGRRSMEGPRVDALGQPIKGVEAQLSGQNNYITVAGTVGQIGRTGQISLPDGQIIPFIQTDKTETGKPGHIDLPLSLANQKDLGPLLAQGKVTWDATPNPALVQDQRVGSATGPAVDAARAFAANTGTSLREDSRVTSAAERAGFLATIGPPNQTPISVPQNVITPAQIPGAKEFGDTDRYGNIIFPNQPTGGKDARSTGTLEFNGNTYQIATGGGKGSLGDVVAGIFTTQIIAPGGTGAFSNLNPDRFGAIARLGGDKPDSRAGWMFDPSLGKDRNSIEIHALPPGHSTTAGCIGVVGGVKGDFATLTRDLKDAAARSEQLYTVVDFKPNGQLQVQIMNGAQLAQSNVIPGTPLPTADPRGPGGREVPPAPPTTSPEMAGTPAPPIAVPSDVAPQWAENVTGGLGLPATGAFPDVAAPGWAPAEQIAGVGGAGEFGPSPIDPFTGLAPPDERGFQPDPYSGLTPPDERGLQPSDTFADRFGNLPPAAERQGVAGARSAETEVAPTLEQMLQMINIPTLAPSAVSPVERGTLPDVERPNPYAGLVAPDERGLQPPADTFAERFGNLPPAELARDTFAERFGGPYAAPQEVAVGTQVDYERPGFDERFGGPYAQPQEVAGGKGDYARDTFADRFGNLPPAQEPAPGLVDTFADRFGNLPPATEAPPTDTFADRFGFPTEQPPAEVGGPAVPSNEADAEREQRQAEEEQQQQLQPLGQAGPKPPEQLAPQRDRAVALFDKYGRQAQARMAPDQRAQAQKYAAGVTPQMKEDVVTGKMSPVDFMARSANNVGVTVMGFHITVTPEMIRNNAAEALAGLTRDTNAARADLAAQDRAAQQSQQAFQGARGEYEARLGAAAQGFEPYTPPVQVTSPAAPVAPPLVEPPSTLPPELAPAPPAAPEFPAPPPTVSPVAPPAAPPAAPTPPTTTAPPTTTVPPATTAPAAPAPTEPVAPAPTPGPAPPAAPAPTAPEVAQIIADVAYGSGVPDPYRADQIAQGVRRNPGAVAAFMQANPMLGPALASIYTPQQLGDMFGDIGWSRGESNPPPPPAAGLSQQQQQQQPMAPTFAQGGLVDLPGYYQEGGVPLPRRDPRAETILQRSPAAREEFGRQMGIIGGMLGGGRGPAPEEADWGNVPTEDELQARERLRPQTQTRPYNPRTYGYAPQLQETGRKFYQWALPWLSPGAKEINPAERALPPRPQDRYPTTTINPKENIDWERESRLQRGGLVNLGVPQMNTAFKQAHFTGLNTRASIPKPAPILKVPGAHLIHSTVPGRTDRIPMQARTGSFVLPADVVSGLGQGNTAAGAKMWGQSISHAIGPMGIKNAIKQRASNAVKMPSLRMPTPNVKYADGGLYEGDEYTPIITAGGEMIIDPEIVAELGGGDAEEGKRILGASSMGVRKQVLAEMKKLPRPVS